MEIEKKFRIDDVAQLNQLKTLDRLGDYDLRQSSHSDHQTNTYYDTADRRLERGQYGLRIRDVEGHCIATLKGSQQVQDGLFERDEWEVEASDPHPATWPESAARTQALAVLGDARLLPLLTIYTERHHIFALRDGQEIAEMSLDSGTIEASGQRQPFCELEIELRPAGTAADIDALEAALGTYLPLQPESRSKLQRGLALLHAGGGV